MKKTPSTDSHRRKTVLCVPANDERKIVKALASGADEVVLDLEDAVPPGEKVAARDLLDRFDWGTRPTLPMIAVRVNAPRSSWCHGDIQAVVQSRIPASSLVIPKVENSGDLAFVDRLLDGVEAEHGSAEPLETQALIETAAGVAHLADITVGSARLTSLILGYADLAASLGHGPGFEARSWLVAQDHVLIHARSAGLVAVDGPFLGVGIDEPFREAITRSAGLGFDAKWAIHPRQIDLIDGALSPNPSQIARAVEVVEALEVGHASGRGAVELDGQMIDEALAVAARRVLARANR